jgi:glutamine synthetase
VLLKRPSAKLSGSTDLITKTAAPPSQGRRFPFSGEHPMSGNLSFDALKGLVKSGAIDTVLACFPDMQGRLMGKRFEANYFVDGAYEETHGCNYLLTVDVDMEPVPGYKAASWAKGYGDFVIKPDLATIRLCPWLEKTALVLSDILDHHDHSPVPHAPRNILKKQLARLSALKMKAYFASELEFFMFDQSFKAAQEGGYRNLTTPSHLNADYNILQTSKDENVMRAIRNGLYGAGITVENSKGEAWAGQEEINVKYDEALPMADTHAFLKHACKEIALGLGQSLTFMAKPNYAWAGSSSHIHQSLWSEDGKTALFQDKAGDHGMSQLMKHYMAGLLTHASEMTYFLAPYINSYKRFMAGTFAPTRAIWSFDNRTAGYRLCGADSKAIRIECRVGGSDLNPYREQAGAGTGLHRRCL